MAYIELGDICDISKGEIGITKAVPGEYPMVTTGAERKSHNKFQLDTEAVLVPLVSSTGHGHASIKRIHFQEGKFAFGSILAACVPKDNRYSAKFLYIYFQLMKDYILVPLMKGSANVSLTLGNLKTAKVPDISREMQESIVKLYSTLKIEQDETISILSNQKSDIDSLKQAILQEAVQGKLTEGWRANNSNTEPASELLKRIGESKNRLIEQKIFKAKYDTDKFEPLINRPVIPNSWTYVTVGNICELITGATPSKSKSQYFGGNIKWLVSGDIHKGYIHDCEGRITEEGMSSSNCKVLPIDSIMIALNGQGKTRATVALLKTEATCNQSLIAMKPFLDNCYLSEYIYYLLKGKYFQIRGITGQKQRRGLNMTLVSQLPIALPPLKEQKAIVENVNSLMALCDELEQQIDNSQTQIEQLMQSCLKEVFEQESN